MRNSSLKRSDMARVNEGSQFYLPPTRLSTSGMSHTCLYSPAAEHHRTLAGTHFPSAECRRLSWPEWLITHRGGLPARRRSLIAVLTGPGVE